MKHIKFWALAAAAALTLSCVKDGEMLIASVSGGNVGISSVDDDIVLDIENPSRLVLTLFWTETGEVVLSNPDAQVPASSLETALQFSPDEEFTSVYESSVAAGKMSAQFTCSELNTLLSRLGYEGGVRAPLYIRLKTLLGSNSQPCYGEALMIHVTPYKIDMSCISIADKETLEVIATIPAVEDREYAGFLNVPSSWYNFYFIEGDSTSWGTWHEDDVTGLPFKLTSDASQWNNWFPEPKGCYWVTMSTSEEEWTAISVPSLTVTAADATADMQYLGSLNLWRGVFTTTSDGASVTVSGTGSYYDVDTGTDNPVERQVEFNANADGSLELAEGSGNYSVTAGKAGTYTLFLYLNEMKWELKEGDVEVDDGKDWPEDPAFVAATSPYLYIYNLVDDAPASVAGKLKQTSDGYQGFFMMGGWYNFKFGDNEDPLSAKVYGSAPVKNDDDALYRLYCGDNMFNLWYPSSATAYTYVTVNMSARSWSYETVESIDIVGNFNNWTIGADPMSYDVKTNRWSATIEPESWGAYGIQFLVNAATHEWNWSYSDTDGDGLLESSGSASIPPVTVESGKKYKVTLDLNDPDNMTCVITEASDEPEPVVYDEYLYVFYSWTTDSKWEVELASTLWSEDKDGVYYGYFSAFPDDTPYHNFTFSTSSTANDATATRYGCKADDNSALSSDISSGDVYAFWPSQTSGLFRLNVDLTTETWSEEMLDICVSGTFNDWDLTKNPMVFNTETRMWEATCDITEVGDGLQIVLGNWEYIYGGSENSLAPVSTAGNIVPDETGTYLITADLRNASDLKYTMTKQ